MLLQWGESGLRDLPWRRTRDPWRILVAEVMLQQTQVARVLHRWIEWCDAYPAPAELARAPLGEALRRWQGLGYPRRARNLRHAATAMVERHGGAVPDRLDALLALPGVGPYTARAVLVFAYEHDLGVVDTNIARVLARLSGTRLRRSEAQSFADSLVPAAAGWMWNQSLIDLGAELCRPVPACAGCPLAPVCRWRRDGRPDPDPAAGSAGVSTRQDRFQGSVRQARGRLLADLAQCHRRSHRYQADVVAGLVEDGLIVDRGAVLSLP